MQNLSRLHSRAALRTLTTAVASLQSASDCFGAPLVSHPQAAVIVILLLWLFFPVSGSLAVQEINIVYALVALAISAVFSSFAVMARRPAALRRHKVTGRLASTAGTMRCGSQPHRRELCSGVVKSTAPFLG